MKKIAIFIAMLAEAQPIISRYGMKQNASYLKNQSSFIRIDTCQYKTAEILLVTPGIDPRHQVDRVALVPAALAMREIIHHLDPQILINAGKAGGFARQGAKVGDVYLGKSPVTYHDRRISINHFREYGIGSFNCLDLDHIAEKLDLKQGKISTGKALDTSLADLEALNYHQADLKEMEAAAIAETCYLSHFKNLIFIKAVTDLLDQPENVAQQFQNNLKLASDNLSKQLYKLIDLLLEEF